MTTVVAKRRADALAYVCEFVGTFILNLSITMHKKDELHGEFQPLAVMFTIIAIVDIGAAISGAHYNAALTLAFYTAGDRTSPNPLVYVLMQMAAAISASFLAYGLDGYAGGTPVASTLDASGWAKFCASDFIGTYISLTMVMYTALLVKEPLGHWGAVLVGTTFYVNIMIFKSVSGAIFNPGLALGLWSVGMTEGNQKEEALSLTMLLLFDLLGGLAAGLTAQLVKRVQQQGPHVEDGGSVKQAQGVTNRVEP